MSFITYNDCEVTFAKRGYTIKAEDGGIGKDGTVTVFADTGNRCDPDSGYFDHHQYISKEDIEENPCAAKIIMKNYKKFLRYVEGAKKVIINGHKNPDTDCIISIYMMKYMLEHGELPPKCEKMVDYASIVDQGKLKYKLENIANISSIMSAFSQTLDFDNNNDKDLQILESGCGLIEYVNKRVAELEQSTNDEISWDDPRIFAGEHPYTKQVEFIKKDYEKYKLLTAKAMEQNNAVKKFRLPLSDDIAQLSEKEFSILDLGKITGESPMFLSMWAYMEKWDGIVYNLVEKRRGNKKRLDKHVSGIYLNPDAKDYNGKDVCFGHLGRLVEIIDVYLRLQHAENKGEFKKGEELIPDLNYFTGYARKGNDGSATGHNIVIPGNVVPYDILTRCMKIYWKSPYIIDEVEAETSLEILKEGHSVENYLELVEQIPTYANDLEDIPCCNEPIDVGVEYDECVV
ncbi:MAG TPA: hypothetical protein DCP90_02700 [Clostridiales bacterium]|nr:MAG: hypothetical protein A2Y22_01550 [Clostridiales bacterium GWD2_32_59]HAN09502.1 hypothetical protein [Clostridiales bacterium]